MTTRLILEPDGSASLRFFDPATPLQTGLIFKRSECRLFHLNLDGTGWKVNDIRDLRIRLQFDCLAPSGETASGEISADHCH